TATIVFDANTNAAWSGTEKTGASAYDTATVSGQQGQIVPTGTVTYQLFTGLDCKAGNELGSAGQVTMSGGNVPHSSATDPLQAGGYSYQAVYSGDSNYKGSTGDCEPFSVTKATPSITTTQDPASGSVGDTYKDKATLAGTV